MSTYRIKQVFIDQGLLQVLLVDDRVTYERMVFPPCFTFLRKSTQSNARHDH